MVALSVMLGFQAFLYFGTGPSATARSYDPENAPPDTPTKPVIDVVDGQPRARDTAPGTVALTFDDGPSEKWTPEVLKVLRRHSVHATFFVVGAHVLEHPDLVRQIKRDGNEIGIHTFSHVDLTSAPTWRRNLELGMSQAALAAVTGERYSLLRPPYSATPIAITKVGLARYEELAGQGYVTVVADRDTEDWMQPGVDTIVRAAAPSGDASGIVLMHDGGDHRAQTVAALDKMIDQLTARGYRFVTVSEGLGQTPASMTVPVDTRSRIAGNALVLAFRISGMIRSYLALSLIPLSALAILRSVITIIAARRYIRRKNSPQMGGSRNSGRQSEDSAYQRTHAAGRTGSAFLPPVSVIVPAYNESMGIADAVRSLVASDYPDFEVIVVDDGSTDGTADVVERLALPGVRIIRQRNAGKPAALQHGIRVACADVLVLVDADTVFEPDTIRRLVQPLADPGIGAVAGNTKVGNRRGLLGRWQHIEYVQGFSLDRRLYDLLGAMPTVPGAIGAWRRAALDEVGGIKDDTLAEDSEASIALCRAGWRIAYADDARAWTETPATLRALWRQRYRWCYGTMQAIWKHRHAVLERGPGGRLGRLVLPQLVLFQVVLPVIGPAVDLLAVYALFSGDWRVYATLGVFYGIQFATTAFAFRLEREPLRPLWALPFQMFVYRQLMYLVVIQAVVTAARGTPLRWQRMIRQGTATQSLDREMMPNQRYEPPAIHGVPTPASSNAPAMPVA
ncbi:bifunctional polysaccharide deacetylase/glycosyltransferase family 2 protein [Frankia sp. Cas3]|uniref:bifunctional polysaccharide deacetylase/glycosyltransferase family 2 protein n=1 Tax=Frankia sp. Cas3 TaxID=3073926 RepID=UPI002AD4949F|nr:bifunctional polysaccharide deacetylase/glycosyltransferase family 2 protein [Frankia sp. Cas3]